MTQMRPINCGVTSSVGPSEDTDSGDLWRSYATECLTIPIALAPRTRRNHSTKSGTQRSVRDECSFYHTKFKKIGFSPANPSPPEVSPPPKFPTLPALPATRNVISPL